MKKLYSLIFGLFLLLPLNAQWEQLKSANLNGFAESNGMVYAGTSVLLATSGGVYKSTDNGVTWNLAVNGLDSTSLNVNKIVFISSRSEVWVSTNHGIFKSTNFAVSWSKPTLYGLPDGGWIDQIGRIGNRLVIKYSYYDGFDQVTYLYFSDDGVNWNKGALIDTNGTSWWQFVDIFNNKALYLIQQPNSGGSDVLWYSLDATVIQQMPLTGLGSDPDIDDKKLSVDPLGNNLFFAEGNTKGIYKYDFVSCSWSLKMNGIVPPPGYFIGEVFGIQSLGSHLLGSFLFADMSFNLELKLYYSADTAKTWTEVTNPGLDFPIFEEKVITAGSGRLIGGYFNSKYAYSDDNGQTWTKINSIYGGSFKYLADQPDGSVIALTSDQLTGLVKSTDNGNTWTVHNGNLPEFMGLHLLNELLPGGSSLYATSATDPFSEKLYLYKSTDGGTTWTLQANAPDSAAKLFVGRNGTNPVMLFENDEDAGTYQVTTDGGSTWVNLSPAISLLDLEKVIDIKGNGSILMLFGLKAGRPRVYITNTPGASFTDITSNLDDPLLEILISDRWDWDRHPSTVSRFSSDGTVFLVGVKDYSTWPNKIYFYRLNDTKDGWNQAGPAMMEVSYDLEWLSLRHSYGTPGAWFFATPVGVYASSDNGNSWLRVWNNEGFQKGVRPKSLIATNYGLFMGTDETGLWRTPLTEPSVTTVAVTDITDISAKSGGVINSTGGLPFINKGICWATHTLPTVSDNVKNVGNTWADFTADLTSLTPLTPYYVRAFVQGPMGLVYGNEMNFITLNPTGVELPVAGNVGLYPNPSNGRFNVVAREEMTMTIMNVIGKVVLTAPVYTGFNAFELDRQPAGIYFVKFIIPSGKIQTIRLVIK
ncbi:MAG: T9SS type A sorting domain-containing protein [Bacteroidales bacterium]